MHPKQDRAVERNIGRRVLRDDPAGDLVGHFGAHRRQILLRPPAVVKDVPVMGLEPPGAVRLRRPPPLGRMHGMRGSGHATQTRTNHEQRQGRDLWVAHDAPGVATGTVAMALRRQIWQGFKAYKRRA